MTATAIPFNPYAELLSKGALILQEKMSKEEFTAFAQRQEAFQLEREADGTVIIMPLTFPRSSKREIGATFFLQLWELQSGMGEVYGPTGGWNLPDGSTRAPDAAWISDERLALMSQNELEESFSPIPPDFVIEVRSSSDRIPKVKEKMTNVWMKNGVRLAWLIDPYNEKAYIYRENEPDPEIVEGFAGKKLSGEDVMPGMEMPLKGFIARKSR